MTPAIQGAAKANRPRPTSFTSILLYLVLLYAVVTWLPNPFARFFEAPANVYRNFTHLLTVTDSPRLKAAVKAALERDGKLDQRNMETLWPIYERALPAGYTFLQEEPGPLDVERQRLMRLVAAKPLADGPGT